MTISEFVSIISTIGFPSAVCLYTLIRVNKSLQDLKDSVYNLNLLVSTKLNLKVNTNETIENNDIQTHCTPTHEIA